MMIGTDFMVGFRYEHANSVSINVSMFLSPQSNSDDSIQTIIHVRISIWRILLLIQKSKVLLPGSMEDLRQHSDGCRKMYESSI